MGLQHAFDGLVQLVPFLRQSGQMPVNARLPVGCGRVAIGAFLGDQAHDLPPASHQCAQGLGLGIRPLSVFQVGLARVQRLPTRGYGWARIQRGPSRTGSALGAAVGGPSRTGSNGRTLTRLLILTTPIRARALWATGRSRPGPRTLTHSPASVAHNPGHRPRGHAPRGQPCSAPTPTGNRPPSPVPPRSCLVSSAGSSWSPTICAGRVPSAPARPPGMPRPSPPSPMSWPPSATSSGPGHPRHPETAPAAARTAPGHPLLLGLTRSQSLSTYPDFVQSPDKGTQTWPESMQSSRFSRHEAKSDVMQWRPDPNEPKFAPGNLPPASHSRSRQSGSSIGPILITLPVVAAERLSPLFRQGIPRIPKGFCPRCLGWKHQYPFVSATG